MKKMKVGFRQPIGAWESVAGCTGARRRQHWRLHGCSPAAALIHVFHASTAGPSSSDLYGKFTWKIEKFSEVSKRELRSHTFEVGSYKW